MSILMIRQTRLGCVLALFCVFAFALWAGWRDTGIDRENYILMFSGIIESEDIGTKFYFAKDILFLLLVSFTSIFSENPKVVFLILCFVSLITKYFAIKKIAPESTLKYLLIYLAFLAPGLEFAAMRSALGIGFLMIAISYKNKSISFASFLILAITSHLTMILAVLLCFRPVSEFLKRFKIGFFAIAILISFSASTLLSLAPSGVNYVDNHGTLTAYFLPATTLLFSCMIFFNLNKMAAQSDYQTLYQYLSLIRTLVYGIIAISFGFSSVIVVASTRYLEVAWCLLLIPAVILFKKSIINSVGILSLIAFLSYINIYRLTWITILDPLVIEMAK